MNLRSWSFTLTASVVVLAACKDPTPSECKDIGSIYDGDSDSDACLEALTARCRAHATQADCWSAEPLTVGAAGNSIYCAWTKVATVTNPQTCEVSTSGRCEAAVRAPLDGPSNGCVDGALVDASTYTAFVDDLELVDDVFSGPDGKAYAMFPYWTGDEVAVCSEKVEPPVPTAPPPPWCSCAAAACMATGD